MAINVGVDVNDFMPKTAKELIERRKETYKAPENMDDFLQMVFHPEIDLSRSPKGATFKKMCDDNRK